MTFFDGSATALVDLLSLKGRVAVVTGGAQGLGWAIARRIAEAGATVVIIDRDAQRSGDAARVLAEEHGREAMGLEADVRDSESVKVATTKVMDRFGRIDIWVNNAGVFPSVGILEMDDGNWQDVLDVNITGVRNGAREAARTMTGGVIINIASTAAFRGTAAGLSAYVASKHAVRGLTRQLAIELAPAGIRVLAVAPGFVPTEGNLAAAAGHGSGIDASTMPAPSNLAGRLGHPDDIARVVLFGVSDLSSFMTGSTLLADAGSTA